MVGLSRRGGCTTCTRSSQHEESDHGSDDQEDSQGARGSDLAGEKTVKAPATRTGAPAKKGTTSERKATQRQAAVDRTAEMSDEVLKAVEEGQRAAIAAVRRFVDTVDEVIPALGGRPSRREQVIDAALDLADKLVTTQYDFLPSVVRSADRSLTTPST